MRWSHYILKFFLDFFMVKVRVSVTRTEYTVISLCRITVCVHNWTASDTLLLHLSLSVTMCTSSRLLMKMY